MRLRLSLPGAVVAAAALATAAHGQARDPTGRYDVDEVLRRHAHDLSQLPTREEAAGRPVTFELDLAGTFSTNAGESHRDTVATAYGTPGFAVDITPQSLAGFDVGGGAKIDADYYGGGRKNDRFGEGRVEGFVFAEHGLGPGTVTAEFVVHSVFDNDFANHDFRLLISDLSYSVTRGRFTFEADAEYEDSEVPELRRTRLASVVTYAVPQKPLGYDLAVEGTVAFADFNGGRNANRNDTVAGLALIADRKLGRGWALEWAAAFVNRFSNRAVSRFTTFDLGVELAKRF